jgi:hypothetical protein
MPQMKQNWIHNLTPKEQERWYNEVVDYFTDEVVEEVFEKYDKPVDIDLYPV